MKEEKKWFLSQRKKFLCPPGSKKKERNFFLLHEHDWGILQGTFVLTFGCPLVNTTKHDLTSGSSVRSTIGNFFSGIFFQKKSGQSQSNSEIGSVLSFNLTLLNTSHSLIPSYGLTVFRPTSPPVPPPNTSLSSSPRTPFPNSPATVTPLGYIRSPPSPSGVTLALDVHLVFITPVRVHVIFKKSFSLCRWEVVSHKTMMSRNMVNIV